MHSPSNIQNSKSKDLFVYVHVALGLPATSTLGLFRFRSPSLFSFSSSIDSTQYIVTLLQGDVPNMDDSKMRAS